ncbi:hypothetical protein QBC39DRAFT_170430 [Podospora conica]|nr:hypothetical protein QBC39DRAFT_170430 [Schizothecium conicum]
MPKVTSFREERNRQTSDGAANANSRPTKSQRRSIDGSGSVRVGLLRNRARSVAVLRRFRSTPSSSWCCGAVWRRGWRLGGAYETSPMESWGGRAVRMQTTSAASSGGKKESSVGPVYSLRGEEEERGPDAWFQGIGKIRERASRSFYRSLVHLAWQHQSSHLITLPRSGLGDFFSLFVHPFPESSPPVRLFRFQPPTSRVICVFVHLTPPSLLSSPRK